MILYHLYDLSLTVVSSGKVTFAFQGHHCEPGRVKVGICRSQSLTPRFCLVIRLGKSKPSVHHRKNWQELNSLIEGHGQSSRPQFPYLSKTQGGFHGMISLGGVQCSFSVRVSWTRRVQQIWRTRKRIIQ